MPSFLSWTIDPIGQALVMILGLSVLARINPWITVNVFLPLVLTLIVVNMASQRIRRYRKANQEAIGAVTDLLGELFGAVQAIKNAAPMTLVQHAPIHILGALPAQPYPQKHTADWLNTLVAANLCYHYPDTQRGIAGVNLCLHRGMLTVVTGRVGSGKTTLLRVLRGLLPKSAGETIWNGGLVNDPAAFFVPPRCAYTAQTPRLFSERLIDNILLGLPQEQVDLQAALHAAVLERDVPLLDQGLDTIVGPRGVKLSGGQIQRAAAARMFARPARATRARR